DVGVPHVALRVGERVLRVVGLDALARSVPDTDDLGATTGCGRCLDVPLGERRLVTGHGVVCVAQVVGDRVHPLAVDRETGAADADCVEEPGHQTLPIEVLSSWNFAVSASTLVWYFSPVSVIDTVSSSRLTLLPLASVGS